MKRLSLAIIFACCTLAMNAQQSIRVNYKGDKPSISDFAQAFLTSSADDEEDCTDESLNAIKNAWSNHRKGLPQEQGETITVDEKNGYVLFESRYEEDLLKIEMCYWNEADKKHKLFAYNVTGFKNGKYSPGQFDGIVFYRYNNATKKMTQCDAPGFTPAYSTDDGAWISYALPRTGKDITMTTWFKNGTKKQATLKWSGARFR